jgi:putative two-component system response regulator
MSNRILIVDDDESNLELLAACLAEVSDEIRTELDSKLAEVAFHEFEPDIVLLDLHMEEPDGLELLRRLRGAREARGFLPVIMLTGETARAARISALILGADEFLTKPFDRTEVVLRVRNLLRTRHLYDEQTHLHEPPRHPRQ